MIVLSLWDPQLCTLCTAYYIMCEQCYFVLLIMYYLCTAFSVGVLFHDCAVCC